jgi:hypothetical protein
MRVICDFADLRFIHQSIQQIKLIDGFIGKYIGGISK